jgi:hypothetical protein
VTRASANGLDKGREFSRIWRKLLHVMPKRRSQPAVVLKRFPVSFLSDIAYFTKPMPRELAETIRTLRRDHKLTYEAVMWALAESDPDMGQCYGFGKALTERARIELDDDDPNWR